MGMSCVNKGEKEKALEYFNKAIKEDSKYADAYLG